MAKQASQKTEKETIGDPFKTGQEINEPGTALPPEDSRIKTEGLAQQRGILMAVAAGISVIQILYNIFSKKKKE